MTAKVAVAGVSQVADDGGISDNAVVNEVRHEPDGNPSGWASLGKALGGGLGGAGTIAGENAYQSGMRVGAQTADALAQAKDRIQKTTAAHAAATALRSPELQAQLKISPALGEYYATQADYGREPDAVTNMMLKNQEFQNHAAVADPSQPLEARHAAAYSLAPASMAPKAEGSLGSVFDPGANGGSGQTSVSPLQTQVAGSEIAKNNATAYAAPVNADAHAMTATKAPGAGGKLLTGNKWMEDPQDPSGVLHDASGQPVQGPDLNANKGEGAVGERYTRRIVNATNGLAKEASNLSKVGLGESVGAQVGAGKGVFATAAENMGKAFSSESSQIYRSSIQGVENQLASIELAGGVPPGTYVDKLKQAISNSPTDTPNTRLWHAATIRQIAEVAAETASENPKIAKTSAQGIYDAVAKIQKSIPFTTGEVQDFRRDGKPGQTFQQFLDAAQREPAETFGNRSNGAASAAPAIGAKPTAPSANDPLGILGK